MATTTARGHMLITVIAIMTTVMVGTATMTVATAIPGHDSARLRYDRGDDEHK